MDKPIRPKKSKALVCIEKIKLNDGAERSVLDSYEKIIYWINAKFEEQKKAGIDEPTIDLSNTIIKPVKNGWFWIGELCGKIDGITHIGNEKEIKPDQRGGILVKNEIQFKVQHKVNFENSILYGTHFYNTEFDKTVDFLNAKIFSGANFKGSKFHGPVIFTSLDISQLAHDNHKIIENIIGRIDFQNITFYDKVYFICLNWKRGSNFHFTNNLFEGDVYFELCSINNADESYYDFSDNIFKADVKIDGRKNPGYAASPLSHINFSSSYFHKKLKIWGMLIGDVSMQNCHFYDTVSITFNTYDKQSTLDFSYSTINCLFFIDSDLGDNEGETIKLYNEIRFYKTLIKANTFLFLRNINNYKGAKSAGVLNFGYANILGNITIQDSNLQRITLGKATVTGAINIENVKADYDCRESITKIKNEFAKRGDIINTLSYRSFEMQKYRMELWRDIKKWKVGKITDILLLGLNTISNNNGRWWFLGVIFTISISFVFYSLFSISIGEIEWSSNFRNWTIINSEYWKSVLSFLWLPNLDGFKELSNPKVGTTIYSYIWFILGKILVAYGIYQTIVAFRKYGK